jgi:hypothetical protein
MLSVVMTIVIMLNFAIMIAIMLSVDLIDDCHANNRYA